LVERAASIGAGIGGVDQHMNLAGAGSGFDSVVAGDEIARACLHAEPVERVLAQRGFGPFAEFGRNGKRLGFEGSLESALKPALCIGLVELGTADGNPGSAARRAGSDVRCNGPVGPKRETDQLVARALAAGKDAGAFGVLFALRLA
jgi:hypothetical protein